MVKTLGRAVNWESCGKRTQERNAEPFGDDHKKRGSGRQSYSQSRQGVILTGGSKLF